MCLDFQYEKDAGTVFFEKWGAKLKKIEKFREDLLDDRTFMD